MSKRTLGKKAAMASDNTTVVVAVHAENNGTNSEAVPDFSLESSTIFTLRLA